MATEPYPFSPAEIRLSLACASGLWILTVGLLAALAAWATSPQFVV